MPHTKHRGLKEYRSRRDFRRSSEPKDGKRRSPPVFVIQQHDASSMHFDFRLEVDGVLKSWAVPKGPSTDPAQKRLAIETEDHPLEYADFEGVIPEDDYGGGTVLVWDRGRYRNLREDKEEPADMSEAFDNGLIEVWLEGKKLSGGYALKRFRSKSRQWLLVKMDDDEADARRNPVSTEPLSVKTGRDLDEIATAGNKRRS